ncbi:unnamed protein product [Adineta ricciae]|uniref:Uncharacterized protein n=1 Tax=Adineta ricciae TaxID=249248 RepID=A0A813ZJR6_ADIRI|nr:unnamed protein product [Adineta ricciae]
MLYRFSHLILPRIAHNIQYFILDLSSIDPVLNVVNYPELHQLNPVNLPIGTASRMLNDESSLIYHFCHQIFHLVVTINLNDTSQDVLEMFQNAFKIILPLFSNLRYLEYTWYGHFSYATKVFLTSETYHSTNVSCLNIRLNHLNDCVCLIKLKSLLFSYIDC